MICQKAICNAGEMTVQMRHKHPGELNKGAQEPNKPTSRPLKRMRVEAPALHGKAIKQEESDEALPHIPVCARTEASLTTEAPIKHEKKTHCCWSSSEKNNTWCV
ncbi:hypothetical protein DQ04_10421020 [Trypanosoma grayi]|uniref:hypothetical protein n=1 Tax=Trypanosoma grayi TaxID=71804 RepID=UPI0004F3FE4F|nr:hypothetical protein DQ04_10421020 [Trypanosoma grayi]KEG07253.1 hypothetical protein DQ04_10421020 [Trypanosoma grayi]